MKIGLVSAEFPPERGGIQTYAWEYARELSQKGHEVTVYTQPHAGGEMPTNDFRIVPRLRLRRRLDSAMFRETKVDVWHVMNAAYSWLTLETAPVFVTVHGNDFLQPYQPVARLDLRERWNLPYGSNADRWLGDWLTRRLVRSSLPRVSHIFTNSRYTEERLCREIPACRGNTSVAMVGAPPGEVTPSDSARRPGPMRLITVCRLAEQHKNVDLVLRALGKLASEYAFHYTVVGDGELRASLEALTDELGLRSRVTFLGFVAAKELGELLFDSDLFVLTTSETPVAYEGFGLVYLEANACGCPVLAARIGGAVEAVEEGVSGGFVTEVTPASIASSLQRFLAGELRYQRDDCVSFARRFSWARVVDHCLPYYDRSLSATL